ncbi:MAG: T9SS type A sorting domain-containing protein [bacterium]
MKNLKYGIMFLFVFAAFPCLGLDDWDIERQLTNNSIPDVAPDVFFDISGYSGNPIVWISGDSVISASYADTAYVSAIKINPGNTTNNANPSIDDGGIVWQAQDSAGFCIYRWGKKIVSSADSLGCPHISYSQDIIVWEGRDGNDWEIYFTSNDGDSITKITDDNYDDRYPSMVTRSWYDTGSVRHDSAWVVWEKFDGNDYEIMCRVFNGKTWGSVTAITNNSTNDRFPCVTKGVLEHRDETVWQQWDGNDWEIAMSRDDSGIWSPETLLTDNNVNDEKPTIRSGWVSNENHTKSVTDIIVWQRFDGNDYEILSLTRSPGNGWDPEIQLSEEDTLDDINPRVGVSIIVGKKSWYVPGICVVWEGEGENSQEIYYRIGHHHFYGIEEPSIPNSAFQNPKLEISQNPFIKSTIIKYQIPVRTRVILSVYDISGSCVKTVINEEKPAGTYTTTLNAKELKAGIYFVRLTAGNTKLTKKLILMK